MCLPYPQVVVVASLCNYRVLLRIIWRAHMSDTIVLFCFIVTASPSGRVAPRSGLAVKHGIDTGAGVIDADYRGNVGVVLFNLGAEDYQVKRGDRVAQLILERIATPDIVEVDDLDATTRGAGGYGSTGKA